MVKFSDSLKVVAQAYANGEIDEKDLYLHISPRLDRLGFSEKQVRRVLNEIELATYTLAGDERIARIVEVIQEAHHTDPNQG